MFYMVGWNGLNGRADFCNIGMPPDRFNELKVDLLPWRDPGEKILICGQVPWDSSVLHINYHQWLKQTISELRRHTDGKLVFRPHPLAKNIISEEEVSCSFSNHTALEEDLETAKATVSFNSNASVESIIMGIPTFVFDRGAMALPVANTLLQNINYPYMPERQQWVNDLAYSQWDLEEIASGKTWTHLMRKPYGTSNY
ncbi:hypothetical protein [Calycomorphotria hydatis]|nr:hypothetical protein [Calycomorphotria hydatis]